MMILSPSLSRLAEKPVIDEYLLISPDTIHCERNDSKEEKNKHPWKSFILCRATNVHNVVRIVADMFLLWRSLL